MLMAELLDRQTLESTDTMSTSEDGDSVLGERANYDYIRSASSGIDRWQRAVRRQLINGKRQDDIFKIEGILEQRDDGKVESVLEAAKRHGLGSVFGEDTTTFQTYLPQIVQAICSPVAFRERSIEYLVRFVRSSSLIMEEETEQIRQSIEKGKFAIEIFKVLLIVTMFFLVASCFI